MTDTFNFLDRMDEYLASGPAVMTTARELCLTDRRVTKAADASRIPEADVRAHVVDVIFDVAKERVHEPLSQALFDHFAAMKAEFEVVEGDSEGASNLGEWQRDLKAQIVASLIGSDVETALGGARAMSDVLAEDCSADKLADAVLAVPVADPAAVLSKMGATPAAIDTLVAELRTPALSREADSEFVPTMDEALNMDRRKLEAVMAPSEWSLDIFAAYVRQRLEESDNRKLLEEGVGYALCESDVALRESALDLLRMRDEAPGQVEGFCLWLDERAAFSTPEQDRLDADEVMRLATQEGGDDSDIRRSSNDTSDVAAGGDAGGPPAAQIVNPCFTQHRDGTPFDIPPRKTRAAPPVAAEESDLTRAVGVALAVLYDHGCETDKAMAEALGVQKAVINQSRHSKTPWHPETEQFKELYSLVHKHRNALTSAIEGLDAAWRTA